MDTIVVLDVGAHTFRAGYAHSFPTDEEPRVQRPSIVQDFSQPAVPGAGGNAARPVLRQPVQNGDICDMDALESLVHHTLYDTLGWELGREGAVIIAEPLLMNRRTREQITQLFFEVFNVEGLFMQDQASLSLYAIGKLNGCVVDIGHAKTDVSTVTDGQVNVPTIRRLPYAGAQMTEYLAHSLSQQSTQQTALSDSQVEMLKEACLQMASSPDVYASSLRDDQPQASTTWRLPDGQAVTVDQQDRYQVAEALMNPDVLGLLPHTASPGLVTWSQSPPLASVMAECLISTSQLDGINKRSAHAKDILVCGGSALVPGLTQRLMYELKQTCPSEPTPGTCAIPEYIPAAHATQHAPWLGGAVLGRVLAGQGHWVTRWDYDEVGPAIVGRKCG